MSSSSAPSRPAGARQREGTAPSLSRRRLPHRQIQTTLHETRKWKEVRWGAHRHHFCFSLPFSAGQSSVGTLGLSLVLLQRAGALLLPKGTMPGTVFWPRRSHQAWRDCVATTRGRSPATTRSDSVPLLMSSPPPL